jgi:hypothetical protein
VSHQGIDERSALGIDDPKGSSDGRPHLCGFADRRQGDEGDTVVKYLTRLRSHLQGEAGLPNTTGTCQREEANAGPEEPTDLSNLLRPADKTGERHGKTSSFELHLT